MKVEGLFPRLGSQPFACCCCCWVAPHVQLFVTPWTAAHQASLSFTISRGLPTFMFIASVMPSSHLLLWHPLLLPLVFPSIRDCSNESSVCIRCDWLVWSPCYSRDFQESSPAPQLEGINSLVSAFFKVQLSQLNVTTGKTVALTIWTPVLAV